MLRETSAKEITNEYGRLNELALVAEHSIKHEDDAKEHMLKCKENDDNTDFAQTGKE